MKHLLRLATRKSALALVQARAVAELLRAHHEELSIEELLVVTSGDRFQDRPLQDLGGKGLFIKEIEQALLDGRADIAVHSIKDVPAELAPGLRVAAVPERGDPRDVLVTRLGAHLHELERGARVGTSSLRRQFQLLAQRPDLDVVPLRGNVDTRLRKVDEGAIDAVVLALAGLRRLGLAERATQVLEPTQLLPAVGQGALGIECRADDARAAAIVSSLDHAPTRICVEAERAFLAAVEGSCRLPIAAHGTRDGDELWLRGWLADENGANARRAERRAPWATDTKTAARLGTTLGNELRAS